MIVRCYNEPAVKAAVERELDRILVDYELIDNDGRHGIDRPWRVARGWTRSIPLRPPGTIFLGNPGPVHFRRFYVHPSGYVVEGGRGGARVFYVDRPHPFISAFEGIATRIRTRSIHDAVEIVEALAPPTGGGW